jgi:hypothetical protein
VRAAGQSVPQRVGGAEGAGTASAEGAGAARDGPAQEDLDEEAARKKRKVNTKLCLCDLHWCQAEVEGGLWLSHGLPKDNETRVAWLKVLCPRRLSREDRQERPANVPSKGRVHTHHFLNRDKKWAGAQLRLQDGAMPKERKASEVPSKQGEELKEEDFTLDGDAGAGPRRKKSSASATFVSPPGRETGGALGGRDFLAGSGASHPSGGAGESSGARGTFGLTPNKARAVAGIHRVVASAPALHRDTDEKKVDAHLATLARGFEAATLEARRLREEINAKQVEIDDLKRQVRESWRAREDLVQERDSARRESESLRRESEESRKESEAAVNDLRRHGNKLAFQKLLPVAQGGDEEVRKNARQLTGFSSAEAFVAMWNVLNHDGAASRMKTWQGARSVRADAERKLAEHSRPNAVVTPWEDIFFYWWFVVKTGVDHSVASFMFGIEPSTASRKFISMTCFQDDFWRAQFPKPSLERIQATTPANYLKVYRTKNLVCIIDCKEIFTATPAEMMAQRALWSEYKQHCTVKFVSAITPAGAALWCSDAFPGRISDTDICQVSGFLDLMQKGDACAADRGFDQVAHPLAKKGCSLTHPPKRLPGKRDAATGKRYPLPFTAEDVEETSAQANLRIHIERAYAAACKFNYVAGELKLDAVDMISRIFRVVFLCSVNFHQPLRAASAARNGL